MEVTFKRADLQDVAELVEFVQRLYEFDNLKFDAAVTYDALRKLIGNDSLGQIQLIKCEGHLIGYIVLVLSFSIEFGGRILFIDEFYIQPEYRGRGVGKKTLKFVEDMSRSLGVRALRLEVVRTNSVALDFYKSYGFEDHERHLMTKVISV